MRGHVEIHAGHVGSRGVPWGPVGLHELCVEYGWESHEIHVGSYGVTWVYVNSARDLCVRSLRESRWVLGRSHMRST